MNTLTKFIILVILVALGAWGYQAYFAQPESSSVESVERTPPSEETPKGFLQGEQSSVDETPNAEEEEHKEAPTVNEPSASNELKEKAEALAQFPNATLAKISKNFAQALNDPAIRKPMVEALLAKKDQPVDLVPLLAQLSTNDPSLQALARQAARAEQEFIKVKNWSQGSELVPQDMLKGKHFLAAQLVTPEGTNIEGISEGSEELPVIFPDEESWNGRANNRAEQTSVPVGFNQSGEEMTVTLNAKNQPEQPILLVGINEQEAMKVDMHIMDTALNKIGMLSDPEANSSVLEIVQSQQKRTLSKILNFFLPKPAEAAYYQNCSTDPNYTIFKASILKKIRLKDAKAGFFDNLWGGAEVYVQAVQQLYPNQPVDWDDIRLSKSKYLEGVTQAYTNYTSDDTFGTIMLIDWDRYQNDHKAGLVFYEYDPGLPSWLTLGIPAAISALMSPLAGLGAGAATLVADYYMKGMDLIDVFGAIKEDNDFWFDRRHDKTRFSQTFSNGGREKNAAIAIDTVCMRFKKS